ncbi:uncharacterized protein CIMG_13108 [Coccidioides immitis RS]|uniref:Uncharacterized protein n=1 Tax=Coccidioides immitis (strain RS) TaxID=246410 RepID=J3K9M6_COCIM|nr:uncharacterized protein CIMG_13108 [Coccidioides immitis RS]EAS31625.3 hypothetical protein CIMG_13108 [Coccidioides immitis RS]
MLPLDIQVQEKKVNSSSALRLKSWEPQVTGMYLDGRSLSATLRAYEYGEGMINKALMSSTGEGKIMYCEIKDARIRMGGATASIHGTTVSTLMENVLTIYMQTEP